jgi:hypothetical protein
LALSPAPEANANSPTSTEEQTRPTQTDPVRPGILLDLPSSGFATTTLRTTFLAHPGGANQFGRPATGGPAGVQSLSADLERFREALLATQADDLQQRRRRTAEATARDATAGTNSGASPPNTRNDNPTVRATSDYGSNMSDSGSAASAASRPSSNLPSPEQTIRRNLEYLEALRRAQAQAPDPRTDTSARRRLEEEERRSASGPTPIPAPPTFASQQVTFSRHPIPPNALVFLLTDPMGNPHSLLVGPAGSALSPPPVYNPGFYNGHQYQVVPPQTQQPQQPGMGVPPPANPQPAAAAPPNPDAIRREILAVLNQNQNAQVRQINIPRLFRDRAGHLWLAIKLSVFVALFAGNGGWRRIIYLGTVACLIFLWQTGVLNELMRPLLDAMYPPVPQQQQPPNAAPAAAAAGAPPQQQQQQQPQMDPANTAAMLINRQEDRVREMIRNTERAFMIFMASLIPGWHDRHVNAIERQQQFVRDQQQQQQREQQQQQQQQQQAEPQQEEPQPGEARGAQQVEVLL